MTEEEALRTLRSRIADRPRGERWSFEFSPRWMDALEQTIREGQDGRYGDAYEGVSSPTTPFLPGAAERTKAAIRDAMERTGLRVECERVGARKQYLVNGRKPVDGRRFLVALRDALGERDAREVEYAIARYDANPKLGERHVAKAAVGKLFKRYEKAA